jgi:hypothetical protein
VTFSEADLAALDAAEEIEIETTATDGPAHRTIIWPIVSDGSVFIRSYRGPGARWYREALADPSVALHIDGRRIAARVSPATDRASVEACSAGFRKKYRGDPSEQAMVRADVLDTTLRVDAVDAA